MTECQTQRLCVEAIPAIPQTCFELPDRLRVRVGEIDAVLWSRLDHGEAWIWLVADVGQATEDSFVAGAGARGTAEEIVLWWSENPSQDKSHAEHVRYFLANRDQFREAVELLLTAWELMR